MLEFEFDKKFRDVIIWEFDFNTFYNVNLSLDCDDFNVVIDFSIFVNFINYQ